LCEILTAVMVNLLTIRSDYPNSNLQLYLRFFNKTHQISKAMIHKRKCYGRCPRLSGIWLLS